MSFIKKNSLVIGYILLFFSLFIPWVLAPDRETLTIKSVNGLQFLLHNPSTFLSFFLLMITFVISLKNKNMTILIFLEIEIVFLIATLLTPLFNQGLPYLQVIKYGYYLVLIILISLFIYYYQAIKKHLRKE